MTIQFNEKGHATSAGNVRVFYYDGHTKEYRGLSDEFIHVGVSIPGNSTMTAPGEAIAGQVWIYDGGQWLAYEDHRGETVYSTDDRSAVRVNYIGPLKDGFVPTSPVTAFDVWDGTQWVTDFDAKHDAIVEAASQEKNALRSAAGDEIAWVQDAADAGIATDEEITLLEAWKAYRVQLMRIKTDTAPDIEWPIPPVAQK